MQPQNLSSLIHTLSTVDFTKQTIAVGENKSIILMKASRWGNPTQAQQFIEALSLLSERIKNEGVLANTTDLWGLSTKLIDRVKMINKPIQGSMAYDQVVEIANSTALILWHKGNQSLQKTLLPLEDWKSVIESENKLLDPEGQTFIRNNTLFISRDFLTNDSAFKQSLKKIFARYPTISTIQIQGFHSPFFLTKLTPDQKVDNLFGLLILDDWNHSNKSLQKFLEHLPINKTSKKTFIEACQFIDEQGDAFIHEDVLHISPDHLKTMSDTKLRSILTQCSQLKIQGQNSFDSDQIRSFLTQKQYPIKYFFLSLNCLCGNPPEKVRILPGLIQQSPFLKAIHDSGKQEFSLPDFSPAILQTINHHASDFAYMPIEKTTFVEIFQLANVLQIPKLIKCSEIWSFDSDDFIENMKTLYPIIDHEKKLIIDTAINNWILLTSTNLLELMNRLDLLKKNDIQLSLLKLNFSFLQDKDIESILNLQPQIECLEISNNDHLTSRLGLSLPELQSLKTLILSELPCLGNEIGAYIKNLPHLEKLSLQGSSMISNHIGPYLTDLTRLSHIDLSWTRCRHEILSDLAKVNDLKKLDLSGCKLGLDSKDLDLPGVELILNYCNW